MFGLGMKGPEYLKLTRFGFGSLFFYHYPEGGIILPPGTLELEH